MKEEKQKATKHNNMEPMFDLSSLPVEKTKKTTRFSLDKGIDNIVGVFCDPIIVFPGGWGDSLPDWLKSTITLERLMMNVETLKTGEMTGTDAEACAYLNTVSLTQPMGHDWTQIYLYIATKVYEKWRTKESGVTMPEDIRVDKLDCNQEDDLRRLKRWLYETKLKHRAGRRKERKQELKEEEEKEKAAPEVIQHAFDLD